MITFNFLDLKKITEMMSGKKGAWYVGVQVHDGHKFILERLRKEVDHVIGIYYVNFYTHMEYIFGRTVSTMQHVFDKSWHVDEDVLNEMGQLCDVVYVSCGDYNPLKLINKNEIYKQFPDELIPEYIRADLHWLGLLRIGQAVMKLMNHYKIYDYQLGCVKDCWKPYQKIWSDKYTDIDYRLINPLNDKYGNNISNSKKDMVAKIDRQILEPWMKTIEDANKHIQDIEGLEVTSFHIDNKLKRIYARIQYEDIFCNESVNINKKGEI